MDKLLKMYSYVDGVNDTPFPQGAEEPLEIGAFRYDAKRMGGAPTITASVNYPSCLDNEWTDMVYAEFRGEKYYLKQTPTSSYNNESSMYKHDIELVSERVILDNVYFYDAVKNSEENSDAVSNSTTFPFFGDIVALKDKLNASLRYADLQSEDEDGDVIGWEVVVDDNITSDEKLIPFDNAFFSNAIQESYNTFKIPYYFKGKKIHFGYTDNTIAEEFSYGVDDALLSITKTNANYKVVNRVTGVGSSDNIPYYYPNNSPKGNISLSKSSSATFKIVDAEKFASEVAIDEVISYGSGIAYVYSTRYKREQGPFVDVPTNGISIIPNQDDSDHRIWFSIVLNVSQKGNIDLNFMFDVTGKGQCNLSDYARSATIQTPTGVKSLTIGNNKISLSDLEAGLHSINVGCSFPSLDGEYFVRPVLSATGSGGWYRPNNEKIELSEIGVSVVSGTPKSGDTITQKLDKYISTSNVLLPPKYRDTDGRQRFYNATNDTYTDDNGAPIEFVNPFVEGHPKEHIITVEDIKPTIKEKRNASNLRIDMFSEFAYDDNDNDETYIDEKDGNTYFKHPYFYGKLRIMDFNLFDHANENQPMTISFTSGDAGACNFEIGATEEYPQMNPVQVDANGNLLRDENGMVLSGIENQQPEVTTFQERQQDTSKYEVWIALKKEEETYGVLMPQTSLRPKACTSATANDGDTFVILGINLPQSYITAAEEKLEKEIIKYMYENNVEKFKFSIRFSRIYFEENPDVLELLDENSRIYIWYNGVRYTLYVTSLSYNMADGEVLPDITVELDDTLAITQNALQNAISQVKADIGNALGNIDITALATPYFIRKDQDDEANGVVNFKKGIKFGEGGKVTMYDDNSAKLTIEYLEVTKKATFTSLEIQEKTHVGGQMLISPAAMNCGEVENILDEDGNVTAYRCYMQTKGQDGEEIFNQFAVGDQAICQTFNAWGSKYYWRLVTAVGEDYIDLSVDDCDEESDIPEAGDKIIQLGHRTDKTRQAAQVLSAHGENAPSFIMYNGIDSYSLLDKNITGIIWNPAKQEPHMYSFGDFFFGDRQLAGNYITFQQKKGETQKTLSINADVTFGANSTGLSNLSEWQAIEGEISGLGVSVQKVQDQVDGVVENWNGEGAPTFGNEPAVNWTTNAEKIAHINDTYINIAEYSDDNPTAGHAWRWCQCGESEGEGNQQVVITGPLTQGEWVKVGQLDVSYNYNYVVSPNGKIEFAYDQEIMILSGPPTYIKVDRSGAIYLLDNYSYFVGANRITLLFEYADYTIAHDKDGNLIKLHWHPIADSDAVRALKEAAEATNIASEASRLNLLANSAEVVIPAIEDSNYNYLIFPLPIGVSTGDTFTFKAEKADALIGDFTQFTLRLMNSSRTDDYIPYSTKVDVGENVTLTFTVTKQGLTYAPAVLLIYAGLVDYTAGKSLRVEHFSLVKGSTAMSSWQDYQGDNGLKNILEDSESLEITGSGTYSHRQYFMSYPLKEGEQYTFMCEEATISEGNEYEILLYTQDNTGAVTGYYGQFVMNTGSHQYKTFTIPKDTPDSYIFGIYSGRLGSANKTLRLTRFSLVKGTRPMMVWKENTDYLTNAFKNGSTKISGGLTMTQAVMVEDENGTVRGMLNGSDYAEDATHGRLIVAAGSEGALASQLAAATTRIYEDGLLETNNIKATGGYFIGGLKATSFLLDFNNMELPPEQGGGNLMPTQDIDLYAGEGRLEFKNNTNGSIGYISPMFISFINGTQTYESILGADSLSINGGSYGHVEISPSAIKMSKGAFQGLRPYTRDVSSGETLTEYDHNVFIASGTIYLPSSPILGQTYKIYHTSTTTLTINGNGNNIRQMAGNTFNGATTQQSTRIEMIELLWGGGNWYATKQKWE